MGETTYEPAASPGRAIVEVCTRECGKIHAMCNRAIEQLSDDQLHMRINPHQNSIAVIMRHVSGNIRSRWTDLFTSDGEKPGRDRESEFAEQIRPRAEILAEWESAWRVLYATLGGLNDGDLGRVVMIRREPHTVFEAIQRQTAHYAMHMGQVLLIAKHLVGERWRYITIPPGGSSAFNASKGMA
ncbi:MAG TPA: DUF1572 family protein [Phycisphaerales bacterium]|nr:DUF1572 family protein [Phycisphaerales bacterium]